MYKFIVFSVMQCWACHLNWLRAPATLLLQAASNHEVLWPCQFPEIVPWEDLNARDLSYEPRFHLQQLHLVLSAPAGGMIHLPEILSKIGLGWNSTISIFFKSHRSQCTVQAKTPTKDDSDPHSLLSGQGAWWPCPLHLRCELCHSTYYFCLKECVKFYLLGLA
jgi:hypothetical protein